MAAFLEDILVCPVCKSKVILVNGGAVCTSSGCRLKFKQNGFWVMLSDTAEKLSPSDHDALVKAAGRLNTK